MLRFICFVIKGVVIPVDVDGLSGMLGFSILQVNSERPINLYLFIRHTFTSQASFNRREIRHVSKTFRRK